jgi:hypothetical protein
MINDRTMVGTVIISLMIITRVITRIVRLVAIADRISVDVTIGVTGTSTDVNLRGGMISRLDGKASVQVSSGSFVFKSRRLMVLFLSAGFRRNL